MTRILDNMNIIHLDKSKGPVVFIGGMNAMPMMYALELKKQNIDVLYFVDAPASDTLSRPENHFGDINYPYPTWIVEFKIKSQIFIPFARKLFARWLKMEVKKYSSKTPQAIVFNGFFSSISPYFYPNVPRVALTHGSDLDSWADVDGVNNLANSFCKRSFFKFLPKFISIPLVKLAVNRQFYGFKKTQFVVYFPRGFSDQGDRVVRSLEKCGVKYVQRYDVSFEPLKNLPRGVVKDDGKLILFSGVRFNFETFSEGNTEDNKGNDLIVAGIAEFYKNHKNIEIHFVEKGPDVQKAKRLCKDLGIEDVVIWHKEMKFKELLKFYEKADICFDQVGNHWIGAIGCYALWLGKPLIANDERAVRSRIWPENNPVLSANSIESVKSQLERLLLKSSREDVSRRSQEFADKYLGPERLITSLFKIH